MTPASPIPVYQLKVVLKGISPMIWRRLQVSGACTMEDLHYILQIAMGWSDDCLNRFKIHGKDYGVGLVQKRVTLFMALLQKQGVGE